MGAFWADAQNLFETASQAGRSNADDCDWAILVGAQGEIRMLDASGWALPGLIAEYGARTAYRLTRQNGRVRLEGRHGSDACLLWSENPAAALNPPFQPRIQPWSLPALPFPSPASEATWQISA